MSFDKKSVLVTGGTGSLGKVLVRRLLSGSQGTPRKIIILSRDEAKQHEMRLSYLHKKHITDEVIYKNFMNLLEFRIGDVRDYSDVCSAIRDVDIIINAAALKQVPTCEYFPEQALLTNCIGAMNIVRAVAEPGNHVQTIVGISTDKACKPVNAMGITKSLQERIFISANVLNKKARFVCVRYGNVLASRGSVIPLFHDQIKNGGPVTITVNEMTRFLLSLEQAVDTVLSAIKEGKPGEIYSPTAPSATILNIAKALIAKRDIPIQVTGIRPGEKLHEILVSEEEAHHCARRGTYYVILPMLPELRNLNDTQETKVLDKEYSSGDKPIGLAETIELLKLHHLMVEDDVNFERDELLR